MARADRPLPHSSVTPLTVVYPLRRHDGRPSRADRPDLLVPSCLLRPHPGLVAGRAPCTPPRPVGGMWEGQGGAGSYPLRVAHSRREPARCFSLTCALRRSRATRRDAREQEFRQSAWGVKADYLELPLGYVCRQPWNCRGTRGLRSPTDEQIDLRSTPCAAQNLPRT